MRRIVPYIFILFAAFIFLGSAKFSSKYVEIGYFTEGDKHWYAKPSGTGDCTTWEDACTFRTAISKCSSSYFDVIHLAPGSHDLDNGSDATGTTISVDNVALRDKSGKPISVLEISRNITKRIETEEKLKESEENHRYSVRGFL